MQQVKGSVLKARLVFAEEHGGPQGVARVLAALPADAREALRTVLTMKWYPFDLGRQLDDAIVRELGGGRREFFEKLGEASAEKNLTTLHRAFLVEGDPHAFLAKASQIYALYYETGRRDYSRTGELEGVLTTSGAETFSAPDCLTVVGWYRRALELCGFSVVLVLDVE
jgi:hypothetical protein